MKVDTYADLFDVMPIYMALTEVKDSSDRIDSVTKKFLIAKLRKSIVKMRATAKYVEEQLADISGAK